MSRFPLTKAFEPWEIKGIASFYIYKTMLLSLMYVYIYIYICIYIYIYMVVYQALFVHPALTRELQNNNQSKRIFHIFWLTNLTFMC